MVSTISMVTTISNGAPDRPLVRLAISAADTTTYILPLAGGSVGRRGGATRG